MEEGGERVSVSHVSIDNHLISLVLGERGEVDRTKLIGGLWVIENVVVKV